MKSSDNNRMLEKLIEVEISIKKVKNNTPESYEKFNLFGEKSPSLISNFR